MYQGPYHIELCYTEEFTTIKTYAEIMDSLGQVLFRLEYGDDKRQAVLDLLLQLNHGVESKAEELDILRKDVIRLQKEGKPIPVQYLKSKGIEL